MDTNANVIPVAMVPANVAPVAPAGSAAGSDFDESRNSRDAERMARYRLVIEQGSHMGVFIYKVLDRETGEVVQQLPREEVARMGNRQDYSAGTVINTAV